MQAVTSAFFVMSIESAKNGLWKTRNVVGSISTQIGSQTSFLLEDRRGGINFLLKMIYLDIKKSSDQMVQTETVLSFISKCTGIHNH